MNIPAIADAVAGGSASLRIEQGSLSISIPAVLKSQGGGAEVDLDGLPVAGELSALGGGGGMSWADGVLFLQAEPVLSLSGSGALVIAAEALVAVAVVVTFLAVGNQTAQVPSVLAPPAGNEPVVVEAAVVEAVAQAAAVTGNPTFADFQAGIQSIKDAWAPIAAADSYNFQAAEIVANCDVCLAAAGFGSDTTASFIAINNAINGRDFYEWHNAVTAWIHANSANLALLYSDDVTVLAANWDAVTGDYSLIERPYGSEAISFTPPASSFIVGGSAELADRRKGFARTWVDYLSFVGSKTWPSAYWPWREQFIATIETYPA